MTNTAQDIYPKKTDFILGNYLVIHVHMSITFFCPNLNLTTDKNNDGRNEQTAHKIDSAKAS
jgi:hypothetical protein